MNKDEVIDNLNDIINKAIDYINEVSNNGMFEISEDEVEALLCILEGYYNYEDK